jgi:plasmid maintenance system antidote protein VapI
VRPTRKDVWPLAQKLVNAVLSKGVMSKTLAIDLNVTSACVSRWAAGRHGMSLLLAARLAELYDVDLNILKQGGAAGSSSGS